MEPNPSPVSDKNNRSLLFLVGGVALFILILLIIIVAAKKRTPTQNTNTSQNPLPKTAITTKPMPTVVKTVPLSETSIGILSWLDSMKNSAGVYYGSYQCTAKTCEKPVVSYTAGIAAIWGEFQQFSKTKQSSLSQRILKDLATYNNKTSVPTLQNDFWHCKFLYDIASSATSTAEMKMAAKNLCDRAQYHPADVTDIAKLTVHTLNAPDVSSLLKKGVIMDSEITANSENFDRYSAYASDFIAKYLWTGDEQYRNTAYVYYRKAVQVYSTMKEKASVYSILLFANTSVDMYKTTKSDQYKQLALMLKTKYDQKACVRIEDCSMLAYLDNELYKVTQDQIYRTQAKTVIGGLANQIFDADTYSGELQGKKAYRSFTNDVSMYSTRMNGILLGLTAETIQ
ncbi:hypothetical protein HGB07_01675 [Candidatus Roizmanbacteria bacterium]|nr:hypothetical protein [Candidatus Roizmanbacteria bacterium]